MKGPREFKIYVARNRKMLKSYRWDDLEVFKADRCKKWRKRHRRPRDGSIANPLSA
jgi:hypothetical protein